ncbi:hypothetical protein ABVK25_004338 [Lepraria finkii]|uniref:37S ribosomal protein S25, mitochondrial n=1 Tax=Lepraria finkii TaxID=1340010 RepID=A0ABR4BD05_9LECA
MGRYDFRPQRVHQTTTQLLNAERISSTPPWYNVVGSITPAQTLVRTQPVPHTRPRKGPRTKKASKLFQPQKIGYEEDMLRREFFKDHPWELARPRMIIEDDGRDSHKTDWRQIQQKEKALTGESVIQRQLWLLHNVPKITKSQAYDQARKEFYGLRLQEDIERRVAREEAMSTGAYFGPSVLDIGMELEDKEYERWKEWAAKEVETMEQRSAAMYTGLVDSEEAALDADPAEYEAAVEEVSDQIPAQGQSGLGGVR